MDYLSRSLCVAIAMLVGLAIAVPRSYAGETLYKTDFEAPPFVAGLPLVGQDGWIAPPPLSPNAAVISTATPRQGKQSVLVPGADLEHQDFINELTDGYYDAIGSYRKPVDHDAGGTETVRVAAHVRVDGPKTADGDNFFSASVTARGVPPDTTVGIGELAISSDGHVYGYSGNENVPGCLHVPCNPPASFLTSAPIALGEWHNLAVEANFATRQMSFFVDDECLGTFPFPVDPPDGNTLARGSMVVYAAPNTATKHKADYAAHFDQFQIKVVEPEECEVNGADR
jgi:hypothetical protein